MCQKIPFMYFFLFVRRSKSLMVQAFQAKFLIIPWCIISYDAGSSWKCHAEEFMSRDTRHFTFLACYFLINTPEDTLLSSSGEVWWCKQERFLQASDKCYAKSEKCWIAAAGWLTSCWKGGGWRHSGHMWKTAQQACAHRHTHTHAHKCGKVLRPPSSSRRKTCGRRRFACEEGGTCGADVILTQTNLK